MDKFYTSVSLSDNIDMTNEGYLVCKNVPLTRAGDLYYKKSQLGIDSDGDSKKVKLTRTVNDIHDVDTISSFMGKPVTICHPDSDNNFVDCNNWKEFSVGTIQNVRAGLDEDSDKLLADLFITDREAVSVIKNGPMRHVSCGYNYERKEDEEGNLFQTNIRGNHVAIVKKGRAGPDCAICDSMDDEIEKIVINEKEVTNAMSLKDRLMGRFVGAFSKAIDEEISGEEKPSDSQDKKESSEEQKFATAEEMKGLSDKLDSVLDVLNKVQESKDDEKDQKDEKEDTKATDSAEAIEISDEVMAKAEILSPGIAKTSDVKRKALEACYSTEQGKNIIDSVCDSFDDANCGVVFNAASEILKNSRATDLGAKLASSEVNIKCETADEINRTNKEYWANRKSGVK